LLDRISLKTIAVVGLAVALAAFAAGFMLDAKGFLGNLLAETVGVVVSVLLAIFIVEKIVERERAKRWALVSNETIASLRFAVVQAGHHVYLLLPAPRDPEADPYTLGLLQRNRLSSALRLLATRIRERHSLAIEAKVASGLRPYLEFIRGSVMPQMLAIGEHDLIARLAAVESAFQDLQHAVWLEQQLGHLQHSPNIVAKLIDALANVSQAIDSAETAEPDKPIPRPGAALPVSLV
jgi:hypothetical protein